MKKALWLCSAAAVAMSAVCAQAADLPVKAPPMAAPPPPFTWTGCYIGGHAGGGWSHTDWTDRTSSEGFNFIGGFSPGSVGENASGWLAGGQIGCDYQVSNWVFGLEVSGSASEIRSTRLNPIFVTVFGDNKTLRTETDWLASFTPRIGYSWDRFLVYVRGGVATSHNNFHSDDPGNTTIFDASNNPTGWTLGGGLEYAFAPSWSAFVEYVHYDFGANRITPISPQIIGYTPGVDVTQRIDVVKAGINWRFGHF